METEWRWWREEIADLAEEVATLLRDAPDPQRRVDGSQWTVGDLGAHLVDVARRQVGLVRSDSPVPFPDAQGTRAAMAELNERGLAEVDHREPAKLGAVLVSENENLLAAYAEAGPSVHWFDVRVPAVSAAAVWLTELLVHGRDLARTLDVDWVIEPEQALAAIDGLAPILPRFVDRERAGRARGTYHVRFRPGPDYTFTLDGDDVLTIDRGRPERADVHLVADPVTYLLVGYGRVATWSAALRGKIRAWGRRPWLAFRFADLLERP